MANERISGNYSEAPNKDALYEEIKARREEREGNEGANLFEGITSSSIRDELEAALVKDDKQSAKAGGSSNGGGNGNGNGGAKSFGAGRSDEKAGVGTRTKPENQPIPDSVKIKRDPVVESGAEITPSASTRGNQSKLVIDTMQSRPVDVYLIPAKSFNPENKEPLVFVQGAVSSELLPYSRARAKFACKPDGTVIYNARGFDDVRPTADFDLVDIVKLIEHNHGNTPPEETQGQPAGDAK